MKAKILIISMVLFCSCQNTTPSTIDSKAGSSSMESTEIARIIDQYLTKEVENGFSGAIMVMENGAQTLAKGYGKANAEGTIPIDENTLFDMGSISKSFTAVAILKLEEMGKLSTEDKITKYFQDVPLDKQSIKIHQLLTHSAGLPGAIGNDYDSSGEAEFLQKTWESELAFPIGEGYEYSNVGYSLLGMIIEKVSETSYDEFLQKNIFIPANMHSTGYSPKGLENQKIAHGIKKDGADWGNPREKNWNGVEPFWHLKANGGILTTANDMSNWYRALYENKILKSETLKKQLNGYVNEGGGTKYGYGLVEFRPGLHYGHNGGNGIFRADWHFFPEKNAAYFLVSNDANVPLFRLSDQILEVMLHGKLPPQADLEMVDLVNFPSDKVEKLGAEFIENLQNYDSKKVEDFIDQKFTPGIVERNSKERLLKIFEQIKGDFGAGKILEVTKSEGMLVLKVEGVQEIMNLNLKILEGKIDGFSIDAGD